MPSQPEQPGTSTSNRGTGRTTGRRDSGPGEARSRDQTTQVEPAGWERNDQASQASRQVNLWEGQQNNVRNELEAHRNRICSICGIRFDAAGSLDEHRFYFHRQLYYSVEPSHVPRSSVCTLCGIRFNSVDELDNHRRSEHSSVQFGYGILPSVNFVESMYDDLYMRYSLNLDESRVVFVDIDGLFNVYRGEISSILQQCLLRHYGIRVTISAYVDMVQRERTLDGKVDPYGRVVRREQFALTSFLHTILHPSMINHTLFLVQKKLNQTLETIIMLGSDWVVERFRVVNMQVLDYSPISAGSYIPTPTYVANKHAVINIKTIDSNMCFALCIIAGLTKLYQTMTRAWYENPRAYESRLHMINWTCVQYPVSIDQIPKFMANNPSISVNVYALDEGFDFNIPGLEGEEDEEDNEEERLLMYALARMDDDSEPDDPVVYPVFVTNEIRQHHFDLLLLTDENTVHYTLLRQSDTHFQLGLSRLLGKRNCHARYFCFFCLQPCLSAEKHARHMEVCGSFGLRTIVFPKRSSWSFNSWEKTMPVSYYIAADFESVLEKVERQACPHIETCMRYKCEYNHSQNTTWITKHLCCSYAFVLKGPGDRVIHSEAWVGPNANVKFLQRLIEVTEPIFQILRYTSEPPRGPLPPFTGQCCICSESLVISESVMHHDHFMQGNNILGWAHKKCNSKARRPAFIPVLFHGFEGYDSSYILQAATDDLFKSVEGLIKSTEKILSLTCVTHNDNVFHFLDFFKFLPYSLSNLAKEADAAVFSGTRVIFSRLPGDVSLLHGKLPYPYCYFDSFSRFDETVLPPRTAFKSDLNSREISEADYEHVQRVYESFQCRNLADLTIIYNLLDAALLCDLVTKFKNDIFQAHGLEPLWWPSLPGVAYAAAFKRSNVQVDYVKDMDLFYAFKLGIRGGITTVNTRYARANHRFLGPGLYDPNLPVQHIQLWDANNLYGYAVSQKMPVGDFRWVTQDWKSLQLTEVEERIKNLDADADTGYLFSVDLIYPEHLHKKHEDLPLAPHKYRVKYEDLSPYSQQLASELGYSINSELSTDRLITDFRPRKNYIVHYVALKLYVELGLRITRVNFVVSFHQEAFLKNYIDYCIEKRRQATSPLEITQHKLMANILTGKLFEDLFKWNTARFVVNEQQLRRVINKPNLKNVIKVSESSMLIMVMHRTRVYLNRPLFCGQALLDISKGVMYNFMFNCIKNLYPLNSKLILMDTDSFCFVIVGENVYQDCLRNEKYWFDLSGYSTDRNNLLYFMHSDRNKRKPGYFKDEYSISPIYEVCALKCKMYSIRTASQMLVKKLKGIVSTAVEEQLDFEDFLSCARNRLARDCEVTLIRKFHQQLYTTRLWKRGLSPLEVKRYWFNADSSVPYGSKYIESSRE